MSCQEIQDLLSAYVDGEVTKEQQSLISDHLKNCQECFKLYQELKIIDGFFLDETEVDPPGNLLKGIMSEIEKLEKSKNAENGQKVEKIIPITKEKKKMNISWQWRQVAAGLAIFFISLAVGVLPLVTHNLALESPLELLQNESQDVMSSENDVVRKADDSDASQSEESTQDQQHGIMAQTQEEESGGSEESQESFTSRSVKTTEGQDLDNEDQGIVGIVGVANLLIAISGSALGVLLIWYARPGKN